MLNTIWSQMENLLGNCFKQLQDNVDSCESLMITTEKYQISMILAWNALKLIWTICLAFGVCFTCREMNVKLQVLYIFLIIKCKENQLTNLLHKFDDIRLYTLFLLSCNPPFDVTWELAKVSSILNIPEKT